MVFACLEDTRMLTGKDLGDERFSAAGGPGSEMLWVIMWNGRACSSSSRMISPGTCVGPGDPARSQVKTCFAPLVPLSRRALGETGLWDVTASETGHQTRIRHATALPCGLSALAGVARAGFRL